MIKKLLSKDFFNSKIQQFTIEPRTPQNNYPEHTHDFSELVIVTEGQGRHILNDYPRELYKGMILYIDAADHHLYENVNNLHLTNILIQDQLNFKFIQNISPILNTLKPKHSSYKIVNNKSLLLINDTVNQLNKVTHIPFSFDNTQYLQLKQEFIFFQLITLLQNHYVDQLLIGGKEEKLHQILNYIEHNFLNEIKWECIANKFNLSTRTLYRYIKCHTGLTPQNYIIKLRLSYAYHQILYSSKPITDIALDCGFNDSAYFSTCFKHEFNITPKSLRN